MTKKRLYLSRKDRMIGGVAGGIAEYFDVDSTLVRIVLLLLLLPGGAGLFAYIAAMIIIPEEPKVRMKPTAYDPDDWEDAPLETQRTASAPEGLSEQEEQEAIEELKRAARDLAEAGGDAAQDVAARVRRSIDRLADQEKPRQQRPEPQPTIGEQDDQDTSKLLGLILVAIGVFFLMRTILPWFPWNALWPVALIAVGAVMLFKGIGDR